MRVYYNKHPFILPEGSGAVIICLSVANLSCLEALFSSSVSEASFWSINENKIKVI